MKSILVLFQGDPVLAGMVVACLLLAVPILRWPLRASATIDATTAFIGQSVSWLILVTVLVSAGNAMVRAIFDYSSNAWLELQWYMFGAVFLLAAAHTLQRNEHVRIDVVFGSLPRKAQHWINLFGHVFMLMPLSLLLIYEAVPFLYESLPFVGGGAGASQTEQSSNAGGLIVWPAKALVLAGFFLLAAQGISEIIKQIAIMRGVLPDPHDSSPTTSAAASLAPEQRP